MSDEQSSNNETTLLHGQRTPEYINAQEVADLLRVAKTSLMDQHRRGRMPLGSRPFGNQLRWNRHEIDAWMSHMSKLGRHINAEEWSEMRIAYGFTGTAA
jgi:predicted DNA-binding transcriptional regulator AlpA